MGDLKKTGKLVDINLVLREYNKLLYTWLKEVKTSIDAGEGKEVAEKIEQKYRFQAQGFLRALRKMMCNNDMHQLRAQFNNTIKKSGYMIYGEDGFNELRRCGGKNTERTGEVNN